AELTRIRELVLNLPELFQAREICGRADRRHHERLAPRRVAQRLENYAIGSGVKLLEVIDYLIPRSEFAVLARRKAQDFCGCRDLFLGGGDSSYEKEQQQCDYSCSHGCAAVYQEKSHAAAQRRNAGTEDDRALVDLGRHCAAAPL